MAEINSVGPVGPSNIPQPNKSANQANGTSFEELLKETDNIAFRSQIQETTDSALRQISSDLIPNEKSTREVVGYQRTFLGTFSKSTTAQISRSSDKITVNSPLGNMKLEMQDKNMVYVEIPQGNFIGKLTAGEDGAITIKSEDEKKWINIQPQSNGEVKVTNKGIDESVFLIFKATK